MNTTALLSTISDQWDAEIVPQLTNYVRVPAKSPHFDPGWDAHGHIERVIRLAEAWVEKQPVRGLSCEIVRLFTNSLLTTNCESAAAATCGRCVMQST